MKSTPRNQQNSGGALIAGKSSRWPKKTHAISSNRRVATLFLGVFTFSSACTSDPVDPITEDAILVVTNKTATLIEGTFADGIAPLRFQSIERAPRRVDVTIHVGDTELAIRIDSALGETAFDAKSGQLSPAQLSTLEQLMAALVETFGTEAIAPTNAEVALRRALNYVIAAPSSTKLPTFTAVSETGWVHLPCACSWNYIGNGWSAQTGRGESCGSSGSPHCPGRCGVGCGPDNLKWPWSWGSGVYTRDCALHDYGLGSWENALDDYTLAPYNCG